MKKKPAPEELVQTTMAPAGRAGLQARHPTLHQGGLSGRPAPPFFSAQGKRSGSPTTVTIHPVEIVPYAANLSAGFSGKGQKSVRRAAAFCKRPKKRICGKSVKRQIRRGLAVSCIRPGRWAAVSSFRAHRSKQS